MITQVGSGDGRVYLHTHMGADAAEIAAALRPYVGRSVRFHPANAYGHVNPHAATYGRIEDVQGTDVTVFVPRTGYRGVVDAFEGFGHYSTTIEPSEHQG